MEDIEVQDPANSNIPTLAGDTAIDTGNDSTPDNTLGEKSPMPMGSSKLPVAASSLDTEDHTKTTDFIERLNSGGAKLGLSEKAQEQLNSYLLDVRKKYANAALRASHLNANSPEYQKHTLTMNQVNEAVKTLAKQVEAYKTGQVEYIKDFDNDSLSHADKVNGKAGAISKLYRGDLDMQVNEDGTINFGEGGKFVPYSAIASHSIKQYDLADKMLKLTNDIYKTAAPMTPNRKSLIVNQIKSMIGKAGGRDAVISLMSDGLIPGFEGIEVPKDLYKPENYPQLQQYFLDHIGEGIDGAAQAGYADKVAIENARHGRSLDYNMAKMQQTYDFKQSHPTASSSGTGATTDTKAPKGYTTANSVGDVWKILESAPNKRIKMPNGVTYISGKEADAKGRYAITIEGNNNRVDYNTFKKYAK